MIFWSNIYFKEWICSISAMTNLCLKRGFIAYFRWTIRRTREITGFPIKHQKLFSLSCFRCSSYGWPKVYSHSFLNTGGKFITFSHNVYYYLKFLRRKCNFGNHITILFIVFCVAAAVFYAFYLALLHWTLAQSFMKTSSILVFRFEIFIYFVQIYIFAYSLEYLHIPLTFEITYPHKKNSLLVMSKLDFKHFL